MTSVRLARTLPLRQALTQLADAGATGVLHVRGRPGGVFHLTKGQVNHVECPLAPGVRTLLTASGRLAADTWDRTAAAEPGRVGELLVELGHLTRGELELAVLGAIYDAAFFVLSGQVTEVRFAPEGRHWLGVIQLVDVEPLVREVERRQNLLEAVHKDSTVDEAPVTPLRTAPRAPVVLSPLQWQLLVHADGQRSPSALAHALGKAAYAVVLEVRRLAAANLLDGAAAPVTKAPRSRKSAAVPAPPPPSPAEESAETEALPRRKGPRRDGRGGPAHDRSPPKQNAKSNVEESVLVRIRTALEALP